MERHEILDAMSELKLYGVRASFDDVAGKGLARSGEIHPLIASLIRAEHTHRQACSISYRISVAMFPMLKELDKFVFTDTTVVEGLVRELAAGFFLDAKRKAIFIGGTGTGKTHLCIAVASAVIRSRAKGCVFNLVDLVNQLEQEKAVSRSSRLSERLVRYDLIVIDDLSYRPFSQSGDRLLFHLISKLLERTSLLNCHKLRLHRLAADVRRRQNDHRHARPTHPPLRRHRDRKHKSAAQKPLLTSRLQAVHGASRALRCLHRRG